MCQLRDRRKSQVICEVTSNISRTLKKRTGYSAFQPCNNQNGSFVLHQAKLVHSYKRSSQNTDPRKAMPLGQVYIDVYHFPQTLVVHAPVRVKTFDNRENQT